VSFPFSVGAAGQSSAAQLHERQKTLNLSLLPAEHSEPYSSSVHRASWGATVATLLSLQLGWGMWLMPHDFARSPFFAYRLSPPPQFLPAKMLSDPLIWWGSRPCVYSVQLGDMVDGS